MANNIANVIDVLIVDASSSTKMHNNIAPISSDRPKEFRPKAERDIFETPISAESQKWPKGRISAEISTFG